MHIKRILCLLSISAVAGCAALDRAAEHVKDVGASVDTVITETPVGQALPADWRAGILALTTAATAAAAAYEAHRAKKIGQTAETSDKTLTAVVRAIEHEGNAASVEEVKKRIEETMKAAKIYDDANAKIDQIKSG